MGGIALELEFFTEEKGVKISKANQCHTRLDMAHKRTIIFTQAIENPIGKIVVGDGRAQHRQLISLGFGSLKIIMDCGVTAMDVLKSLGELPNLNFGAACVDGSQRRPRIKCRSH
ncbi:unnamed protein product [Linum trigynum]|uniref:Uncharacterized protein n=1 Tax=Linum trigynum TaxID=586398 RepID=A0AAV2F960_9ROSI